jgi:hypothetical protein
MESVDQTVRHVHDETYLATGGNPGALQRFLLRSRNASAVSDAPHMEWQVDF